jgi:hypothetical protein
MQDVKHLLEITPDVIATAERGARFHPNVGSTTPNGFTTSHPRAETTMLRGSSLCLPVTENEGYSPYSPLSLTLYFSRVLPFLFPSRLPLIPHSSFLFSFRRGCMWHDLPHGGQV